MSKQTIKSEIDKVEQEEDFYVMDVDLDYNLTCKIQYNNRLYDFKYSQNYPSVEPVIIITHIESGEIVPFVFGESEWSSQWSTYSLIITLDANMNKYV